MSLNKKINAYTLTELIIVIIITSIIAGLSFSVLNLVHRHMSDITNNFEKEMQLNQTELRMRIDFNKYSKVEVIDENRLVFKNYKDSVTYQFDENFLRIQQDTLDLDIVNKTFYFNGEKIINGKVDAIELVLWKTDKSENRIFVYKNNDALNRLKDGY